MPAPFAVFLVLRLEYPQPPGNFAVLLAFHFFVGHSLKEELQVGGVDFEVLAPAGADIALFAMSAIRREICYHAYEAMIT